MFKRNRAKTFAVWICALLVPLTLRAGTTGKLVGTVLDAETGEPLAGANVIIEGTSRGAATDLDGDFIIVNLIPSHYTVTASVLGYQSLSYDDVGINIDRTTTLEFKLNSSVLQAGEAVTVTAKAPIIKRDLTSSEAIVGDEQLQMTPIDNLGEAVNLQAGVVNGHFRGGRSSEVAYMIDGVIVSDPYSSSDPLDRTTSNQVEVSSIQEIQVISGTFNAEYGQAMSGIINVITKEGDVEHYSGSATIGFGDYVSTRSLGLGSYNPKPDRTTYMQDLNPTDYQDVQFSLSGPVPLTDRRTSFYTSFRNVYDHGNLYGQRIFLPSDSSNFSSDNPASWSVNHSGDGAVVTLNPFRKATVNAKVTHRFTPLLKLSYSALWNDMRYQNLDGRQDDPSEDPRLFKYDPEGNYKRFAGGQNHLLGLNHTLNDRTFYTLNLSYTTNYEKYYVHENPYSPKYVNPDRLSDAQNFAFYTGGQGMWHHWRETEKAGAKFDLTSQVTKTHLLKAGWDLSMYRLQLKDYQLIWDDATNSQKINPPGSWNNFSYPDRKAQSPLGGFPFDGPGYRPLQFAAYLQDKMEYQFMVVNFGLRFDYFHPDGIVPEDLLDPSNDVLNYYDTDADSVVAGLDPVTPIADPTSNDPATRYHYWRYKYLEAKPVTQLSPRVGIAFPISASGVLHFSYGHFFQIPPFQYLYENPGFTVLGGPNQSIIGNAQLKPESTVMYEVGLQQQISDNTGVSITGYYKDVRNLLGTEVLFTYNQVQYARYINKDYANVRGITVAFDRRMENYVGVSMDYTFQVAEGNSSDPLQVYNYSQSDPPQEPEKKVRPLDWDQTHTLNATVTFGDPSSWSIGLIGRIGSGLPYTSTPYLQPQGELNDARRPLQMELNLKAYKVFNLGGFNSSLTLWIYNLPDLKNENDVYGDTGRATYTLSETQAAEVRGYNTLSDYFSRPEWFSAPRQVRLVFSVGF